MAAMPNKIRPIPTDAILAAAGFLIIGFLWLAIFFNAYASSKYFCGEYSNGAFEHLNPLRRLAAGQIPGRDFQNYHGIGLVYLSYPIYVLLGQNLFASQMSRYLLSPSLFLLSTFIFFFTCSRKFGLSTLLTGLMSLAAQTFFVVPFIPGYYVDFGIRTAFPVIAASIIILLLQTKSRLSSFPYFHLISSFFVGLSFFIATEQGLAAFAALIITLLFFFPKTKTHLRIVFAFAAIVFSFAWVLLFFLVSSGKYFLEPIHYALVEQPADQFWNSGAPPNPFLQTPSDLLSFPYIFNSLAVFFLLLAVLLIVYKKIKHPETPGVLFLLIYGFFSLIPLLSYLADFTATALVRTEALAISWIALIFLPHLSSKLTTRQYPFNLKYTVWGSSTVIFLFLLISQIKNAAAAADNLQQGKARYEKNGLQAAAGVYLCDYWLNWQYHIDVLSKYIPQLKNPGLPGPTPKFWSTFPGLPELILGQFNQADDYMAFSVGPQRRSRYVSIFNQTRPDIITTIRKNSGGAWEEWLQNNDWDFYTTLLKDYQPIDTTLFTIVWKRAENSWTLPPDWDGIITPPDNSTVLEIPLSGSHQDYDILDLQIDYEIKNPWPGSLYIGKLPRFLISIENSLSQIPISLPPYWNQRNLPVILKKDANPVLRLHIAPSLPGVNFFITKLKYRVLKLPPQKRGALLDIL
jgi:MFS family permease